MLKEEEVLEFYKIKGFISEYCKTERGKKDALEISPFQSLLSLNQEFDLLKEIDKAYSLKGYLPIEFSINLIPLIELAEKGGILSVNDLDHIASDILTSLSTYHYLVTLSNEFPLLKDIAKEFKDLSPLEKEIHRVINKSLLIEDKATQELFNIRRKMLRIERELTKEINEAVFKHKDHLVDTSSTIRDGHFVIPVKTTDKNKVKGIIHDVSDTGVTTFIEPEEIVSLNNELVTLKFMEQEEIKKILRALTNLVLISKEDVIKNNYLISKLDLLKAKLLYGNEIDGVFATSSNDELTLISARHPLLNKSKVVANSFYLNKEKRILLISGPNAGGKTICLKTVGLLSYMHLCGLLVSAKEAKIPYFKNIYLDIGDSQSIEDSLSTFSAHISHITEICNKVGGNDLVLIDELGTGTDPKEGEAIALGVIKHFINKNCYALISSHFSGLKEYAVSSKNMENGSMIFDEENLVPTYIFKSGLPGESYALEVAARYGLAKNIIDLAKEHLKETTNEMDTETLLKDLRKKTLELEREKDELLKEKEKLKQDKISLEKEFKLLDIRKEKLLESAKDEKERIIEETNREIEAIMDEIKNKDLSVHDLRKLQNKVNDLQDKEEEIFYNEEIKLNDYVSIPSLEIEGKVTSISKDKATVLSDGGMSYKVDVNKLHKIEKEAPKKKVEKSSYDIKLPSIKPELNIIGLHVDEGKEALFTYINASLARNFKQVRIIHGFGSGKLRNMVHEELKKNKNVASFRLGELGEGGGGATIVLFKEKK